MNAFAATAGEIADLEATMDSNHEDILKLLEENPRFDQSSEAFVRAKCSPMRRLTDFIEQTEPQ